MKVIRAANRLKAGNRPVCAAIGIFDGVHRGHQQLLRQTIADALRREGRSLVITFDRHPNAVVAPERVPPLIQSLDQRLRTLATLGVDALLLIHFDRAFSEQTGEAFIRQLAADLGTLRSISVGADFVFGHRRSGNVALLDTLGAELGFRVHSLGAVSLDDQTVSSTRIREAIRRGDFPAASRMLGRPYSLTGPVVAGDRLGRQLGFPTANLQVDALVLPPNGVYAVWATARRRRFRGVMNLGLRPTLNQPAPRLHAEVHLLDFAGDLYGEDLELMFATRLRDERRFASTDELRAQIARDITAAERHFAHCRMPPQFRTGIRQAPAGGALTAQSAVPGGLPGAASSE